MATKPKPSAITKIQADNKKTSATITSTQKAQAAVDLARAKSLTYGMNQPGSKYYKPGDKIINNTSSKNTSNQKKTVSTKNIPSGMAPGSVDRSSVFTTSSYYPPPPPVPPTPPDVIVRTPERDVVNFEDENLPTELITNLLFENLGANELIKFERHDTIEGTNTNYDIISNLSSIRKKFDPAALISRQKPDTSYFDIFNIKLEDKIPTDIYLRNNPKVDATGEINVTDYVYIDQEGNLVIELVNIESDEILEVEIDSNGTIYEVQL